MKYPPGEAIILAGGLGTRMSAILPGLPKAMADIGGRPFLEILLDLLGRKGIGRVVLATGHLHDPIERHFGARRRDLQVSYSVEERPLGTGGAVWKALALTSSEDVLVLNGDTFFDVDFRSLQAFHRSMSAHITVALKPMRDFDRYGTVIVDEGIVTAFREKQPSTEGLINGGIYVLSRRLPALLSFPERFSLEKDLLENTLGRIKVGGYVSDGYFVDIGVPEDYARARRELPAMA